MSASVRTRPGRSRRPGRLLSRPRVLAVVAALAVAGALTTAAPALAAGTAPGAPGANATWNESNLQAFADSLGSASKVWYTLGNGELENVFYPQADTPDTFGLQYIVTDGSTFTGHRDREHQPCHLAHRPHLAHLAAGEHGQQRRLQDH